MKGKKLLLARLLYRSRVIGVFRRLGGPRLIVFNYHRIRPHDDLVKTIFDDEVFGPSVARLTQHLTWLKNNTDILTESELISILKSGAAFSTPSCLVTFDDGYKDNYELVYPVLRQLKIPAVFFIPTGQIASRELGWWDLISYLIKHTSKLSIRFDGAEIPLADRSAATRLFLNKMRLEPFMKTKELLPDLAEACDVPLPDRELQSEELMTWNQIREVSSGGIAIGSHTHSHRVLATISPAEQEEELRVSKEILERELGRQVRSVSYPVGHYDHFSEETQTIASRCGYELGFSYNTGVNWGDRLALFDIKRVDPREELELIAAMSLLPMVFA